MGCLHLSPLDKAGLCVYISLSLALAISGSDIRSWHEKGGERRLWTKSDEGAEWEQRVPADPPLHIHSRPFYQNVYDAIRKKSPVVVAPELSRKYVVIAEAIARSSRTHECITVP